MIHPFSSAVGAVQGVNARLAGFTLICMERLTGTVPTARALQPMLVTQCDKQMQL